MAYQSGFQQGWNSMFEMREHAVSYVSHIEAFQSLAFNLKFEFEFQFGLLLQQQNSKI